MSSTLNSSTKFWEQFFLDAGIQPETAMDFAVLFSNHHLTKDMLLDITKDHLIDMGINMIGDIILIQKHAKYIYNKEVNQLHKSKYSSTNSNASSTTLSNVKEEKKNIVVKQCEPMELDIKDSKTLQPMISPEAAKAHNVIKKEIIYKKDKGMQVESSQYLPIVKAPAKEVFSSISKQINNNNSHITASNSKRHNVQVQNFKVKPLQNRSQLRPGLKSRSQGIFANEDRPYKDILGKTSPVNSIKERVGHPSLAQSSTVTPFMVTFNNSETSNISFGANKSASGRREFRGPIFDRKLPKVHEPLIIRRGKIQKTGFEVRRTNVLKTGLITKNQSSVFSRLGQKSAKERLG